MVSIGQELQRERELRGITLKEIADSTKINLRFLRALEEDQLDMLPGDFFTKGIIRTYASYIGLDEDAVMNKYYEIMQLQEQTLEEENKQEKIRITTNHKIKNIIHLAILIFLILVIPLSLYFIFHKKEPANIPIPLPTYKIAQKDIILPPPVNESTEEEKVLNLEISFHQETWIQVYADGIEKLKGLKQPGEKFKTVALEEILFNIGNAGGFSYTINNKKGKSLGRSGAVVKNIRITPDNFQQFLE